MIKYIARYIVAISIIIKFIAMKLILMLIAVTIASLVNGHLNATICVNSFDGANAWNIDCHTVCNAISECDFGDQWSLLIALQAGNHILTAPLQFHERHSITIQGSPSEKTKISCLMNAGFLFTDISELSISNLNIENCSTTRNTKDQDETIASSMYVSEIGYFEMLNTSISNSLDSVITVINVHHKIVVSGCCFLRNNFQLGKFNTKKSLYKRYDVYKTDSTRTLIRNSKFIGSTQANANRSGGLSITFNRSVSSITLIEDSVFSNITGGGLLVQLHQSSNSSVIVSRCFFTNSIHFEANGNPNYSGGGGAGVVMSDSADNAIIFVESIFSNNTALTGGGLFILFLNSSGNNTISIVKSQFLDNGKGVHSSKETKGGGVSVAIRNDSYDNNVSIGESVFAGNSAERGAGLHIHLHDSSRWNNVSIVLSNFTRNMSPSESREGSGGGIEAGYYFKQINAPVNNSISIIKCNFKDNYANYGGGTHLFSSYAFRTAIYNRFILKNCLWQNNSANYGAAVDLSSKHSVQDYPPQGIVPIPEFTNCTFISNRVVTVADVKASDGIVQSDVGKGTFISSVMSASFTGVTRFENCTGSAVHITSGFLTFEERSNVVFINNFGSFGGAVYLVGRSSILIKDNSNFSFIKNSALLKGGAITYFSTDGHSFATFRNCFIHYVGDTEQVHRRNITFLFDGNSALRGHSIYATTVEHCRQHYNCNNSSGYLSFFSCIADFKFPTKDSNNSDNLQVITAGRKFKVNATQSFPMSVIPGKTFDIPVVMLDEFDHPVHSQYNLRLNDTSNFFIPSWYSVLTNTSQTVIYGNPGDGVEVTIFSKEGLHEVELKFNVTFQNCPPGYYVTLGGDQERYKHCVCSPLRYEGIKCTYRYSEAQLIRGYWLGYDKNMTPSETSLLSGYCPEGYCNQYSNSVYPLPTTASREALDQAVCSEGRTGILCGKCKPNHSVFYHGWVLKCLDNSKCSYGPVMYIAMELLPITLLFVIILVFDIPFTSGAANGFLLFSQVIETLQIQGNRFIWFPASLYGINTASIRFVYKIFTLQFFTANDVKGLEFLSFCLWKGSTSLDMLAIHYATLIYSLLLVIVTVKIINSCNIRRYCCECCFKIRRKRTVRGSITHGLTTFLLLCYSRFAQVSLMILIPGTIYGKGGNVARRVVFYDGEVDFFKATHLAYAVPALIFSVVLFLLPLLLTVYPTCYKIFSIFGVGESKIVQLFCKVISIERLKPVLDSFQGCFKDRFRFFAGLYFFYRLFAVIGFAYTSSLEVFYLVVEVQLILMLMIHAFVQPYKKRWHNVVDAVLFADLALINAITTFNFGRSFSRYDNRSMIIAGSIQALLIWLPGVYMAAYVTWYILMEVCEVRSKCKRTCCVRLLRSVLVMPSKIGQLLRKKSKNKDEYHTVELQSFYHSYEDS